MLDEVLYINSNEMVLIFTHRPPFRLLTSDGSVLNFYNWFCAPRTMSLEECERRHATASEETCPASLRAA